MKKKASPVPPPKPGVVAVPGHDCKAVLREALRECSVARIAAVCLEQEGVGFRVPDPRADRAAAEGELARILAVERLNGSYRAKLMRQIRGMGGVKITFCAGKGAKRFQSFAYTTGFTVAGGKELLIQDQHRAGIQPSVLNRMFHWHVMGNELKGGDTCEIEKAALCTSLSPLTQMRYDTHAVLLKATKTLEPTRLYGLTGYDILLVVPHAERTAESDREFSNLLPIEKSMLAAGKPVKGFAPIKAGELAMCSSCGVTETQLGRLLFKCMGCKNEYYCSKSCQRQHWAVHKPECRKTKEQRLRDSLSEIFFFEDQGAIDDALKVVLQGKASSKK